MIRQEPSQRERAVGMLKDRGMARLSELVAGGVTAACVSRLEREGVVVRLSRGLYQLADAPLSTEHDLAEAAKLVPRGVVCLVSALAFHELTDRIPSKVWLAIGPKDWRPRIFHPPIRFVRFPPERLEAGLRTHDVEGVPVRITEPSHTVVDLFRYRRQVGLDLAIGGLKAALRTRTATPAEVARIAADARVWPAMRPYLEALTIDG
ncbi:type IV toxin-antitoxin system AbiEi family antitoxin domain-containing protein [Arenibaculum sp.]|jgi:predicted transcriptional regulator of viral defense system|uniref:type IV toxin-antitoxin system AbiEi family antitoxin domain-containing protein n=1 Tax=Arenibaculum sp. TaxID=2865862 RepID=UPI002E131199|nr:type IV toxin-antitoxin system AbiEi family antitoxin domain-containing protein [Arenibaculum sp.]